MAYVDATEAQIPYDLTDLLIRGQQITEVAVVRNIQRGATQLTLAGPENWDFKEMFALDGYMPNRVNLPDQIVPPIIEKINTFSPKRKLGE